MLTKKEKRIFLIGLCVCLVIAVLYGTTWIPRHIVGKDFSAEDIIKVEIYDGKPYSYGVDYMTEEPEEIRWYYDKLAACEFTFAGFGTPGYPTDSLAAVFTLASGKTWYIGGVIASDISGSWNVKTPGGTYRICPESQETLNDFWREVARLIDSV